MRWGVLASKELETMHMDGADRLLRVAESGFEQILPKYGVVRPPQLQFLGMLSGQELYL